MSEIPQEILRVPELYRWFQLKDQIAKLRVEEHFLREKIVRVLYPTPKEGTNNYDLGALDPNSKGYILKYTHGFNRKVDKVILTNITEQCRALNINVDNIVRWTPELETKKWRELTAEQATFFNQCLEIKPESPQLKVEPTADKKKEIEAAKAAASQAASGGYNVPTIK